MGYVLIGAAGVAVAAVISKSLKARSSEPFGGRAPRWVSFLYAASLLCAVYGLYHVVF
jgi:hypothetical protein